MSFNKEIELFHELGPIIIAEVQNGLASNEVTESKKVVTDFATKVDVAVEDAIVAEIKRVFPEDAILAEEGYSGTQIGDDRIWVIDPICGTNNLAHELPSYCSNIALVQLGKVVAACVVDPAQQKYYWSVEGGSLYEGKKQITPTKIIPGTTIDVDFGCWYRVDEPTRQIHRAMMGHFLQNRGVMVSSINTSLSMLYVALRKYDAHFVINTNPWDCSAGSFLAMQAGCVVTAMDGTEWNPKVNNVMMAGDAETHAIMRKAYDTAVAQVR